MPQQVSDIFIEYETNSDHSFQESSTMDPFQSLPSAIIDHILQNFSGKELLKLSKVSFFWHEIIGNSPVAMNKIKIKIHWRSDRSFFGATSTMFVKSRRKYQHLEFLHQSSYKSNKIVLDVLRAPGRKWKSLMVKQINFKTTNEVRKLLKLVAPTVESIDIHEVFIFSNKDINLKDLKFPKLRDLAVEYVSLSLIDAFDECRSLQRLAVSSSTLYLISVDSLSLLLNNNALTSLEISMNLFQLIFSDSDTFKLALSSLKLKSFIASGFSKFGGNSQKLSKIPGSSSGDFGEFFD
jgi:hypothetical protein